MPFVGRLSSIHYENQPSSFFLDLFHQIIEVNLSPPHVECINIDTEAYAGRRVYAPVTDRTPGESTRRPWLNYLITQTNAGYML